MVDETRLCAGCRRTYTVTGGDFDPDWTMHPGTAWAEIIEHSDQAPREVAQAIGVTAWPALACVLECQQLPDAGLTVAFARHFGIEPRFLWQLRVNYELDLALGKKDVAQ